MESWKHISKSIESYWPKPDLAQITVLDGSAQISQQAQGLMTEPARLGPSLEETVKTHA